MAYSPRVLFAALRNWKRVLPLMLDERVPLAFKGGTAALGLLIVSPLDVFADIPILGFLDDAVLLTLLATAFVYLARRFTERPVPAQAAARPPMIHP